METLQYPKAIADLENTMFLVVVRGASCSEAQFAAQDWDHARLSQFPPGVRAVEEGS